MVRFSVAVMALLVLSSTTLIAQDRKDGDVPVPQIGHMVFFKLKESTKENQAKLVSACKKYLGKHEGTVHFSVGAIAKEFNRDVNVQDWDVALHLVFKNKAAHDKYQDHPDHLKFIEENKELWDSVRVFDSEILPIRRKDGEKK